MIVLSCIAISCSIYYFIDWQENRIKDNHSPYYGGIMDTSIYHKIENITEYIKTSKKKVIILSHDAAFYMINLKESNGKMDLPFKGNLGMKGEEGLIEEISQMKEVEILIKKKEEDMNWQESKIVRNFIIGNYEYIAEIEDFLIYTVQN